MLHIFGDNEPVMEMCALGPESCLQWHAPHLKPILLHIEAKKDKLKLMYGIACEFRVPDRRRHAHWIQEADNMAKTARRQAETGVCLPQNSPCLPPGEVGDAVDDCGSALAMAVAAVDIMRRF